MQILARAVYCICIIQLSSLVHFFSICFAKEVNYSLPDSNTRVVVDSSMDIFKKLEQESVALTKASKPALVFVSISKEIDYGSMGMLDLSELFGGRGSRRRAPQKQEGTGSGYFIDLDKGYILTNNHVIDGADEITLKVANGNSYKGKVVGSDPNTDIAVIQVESGFDRKGLSHLVLADSDQVKSGSFVWGLGNPLALESSVSFGVISATGRGSLSITTFGDFLQTDTAINPGNSGGPLINVEGKVVGMNTAIFSQSGGSTGIGFAVPSNLVRRVATNLINGESETGYIGVFFHPQDIDQEFRSALGLKDGTKGVLVTKVIKGGPADKGGLQARDVVTSVNGKKVENWRDFRNQIGLMVPGTKAKLDIIRSGKSQTMSLVIGEREDTKVARSRVSERSSGGDKDLLGLELTFENGQVVVSGGDRKSPANGRLRRGDILVHVGDINLEGVKDFDRAVKAIKSEVRKARKRKRGVILIVQRDNGYLSVPIPLERS